MKKKHFILYGLNAPITNKTILIMKLTFLMITLNLASSFASVYSQKVSLNLKDVKLSEAIIEITKQTNLDFAYSANFVDIGRIVSISVNNTDLKTVLDKLLDGTQLLHLELKGKIYIGPKELYNVIEKNFLQQQKHTGTVTDATNDEPIIGANVVIEGTTLGTVTDASGKFSLEIAKADAVLVVTYLGYNSERVSVNGQSNLNIKLIPDITKLDEVVVIGYGTQKRKDVTGSISSISSDDITKSNPVNIDQAFQGRISGVQASSMGGKPGAPLSINIRGINSPNGNEPLYVIDGIPVGNGSNADQNTNGTYNFNLNTDRFSKFDLTSLNPNDVESIDILKDASATAIYGSRAANGVVVITTKRGKKGNPKVNFDMYYGTQRLAKKIDMLGAKDYMELMQESRVNGSIPRFASYDQLLQNKIPYDTNWQDAVYRVAPTQNYNLSISGANEKLTYFLSGGYMNQEGILGNQSGFDRYSLRANIDNQVRDWLKIGVNLNGSKTTSKIVDQQNNYSAPFDALADYPFLPVRWNAGDDKFFGAPGDKFITNGYSGPTSLNGVSALRRNPALLANEFPLPLDKYMAIGNIYVDLKLFKGLTYHLSLGGTFNDAYYHQFTNVLTFGTQTTGSSNSLNESHNSGVQSQIDHYLTYHLENGNHNLTLMAGQSATKNKWSTLNVGGSNFPIETESVSLGTPGIPTGHIWESSLQSLFGRVNYAFNDKYLVTATIRRDGSSVFGPNDKYGIFPSVAMGWRLSNEGFMKKFQWISNLKVRGSWGQTGAQNINPYQYLQTISADQQIVSFGNITSDAVSKVAIHNNIPNPDLKWEATTQLDAGFDLSILKNKVSLVFDLYKKTTSNLLLSSIPVPSFMGYNGPSVNLGEFQNKGIEIQIDLKDVLNHHDFKWDIALNYSMNRNKVVSIGYNGLYIGTNYGRTYPDNPWGTFYGYQVEKIFQNSTEIASLDANAKTVQGSLGIPDASTKVYQPNSPQPGDIKFKDINGTDSKGKLIPGMPDGIIDQNDQTIIGNPNPKFICGLTNSFSYKNFDLNVTIQGVYGNKIFNSSRMQFEQFTANGDAPNQTIAALNRWKSDSDPGNDKTPRTVFNDPNGNGRVSDRWIEDGSYLRVKNITLGYTIPSNLLHKIKISSLRVYLSLNNYFTLTKYAWYNPDLGNLAGSNASFGVDNNIYPLAKTMMFGLNVGF